MNEPLVSQILCFYNESKYLSQSIESLINQSYSNLEIILIDDGSTDDSLEIAKSYSDSRIKIIENKENHGLAWTRNQGLDYATGDYIGFTDADDISLPERIQELVRYLDNNSDIDIVSSGCRYIDVNGDIIENNIYEPNMSDTDVRIQLLFGNPILGPGALFRRKLIIENGIRNDANYRVSQDWHFWLQCIQHSRISIIPIKPYLYRLHESKAQQFAKNNNSVQAEWRSRIIQYAWNSRGINISFDEASYIYRRIYRQYPYISLKEKRYLRSIIYKTREAEKEMGEEQSGRIISELKNKEKEAWYLSRIVLFLNRNVGKNSM